MLQDLPGAPTLATATATAVPGLSLGAVRASSRGRGLQQLSDLLQGDGVVVVGDLGGVLGDPAQNLLGVAGTLDQALHGEEGVIAHLLVDEVPRLLLPTDRGPASSRSPASVRIEVGVVVVVRGQGWRGQVGGLGVIVGVEVHAPVGVRAAGEHWVGGGGLGGVVGQVWVEGVGGLQHGHACPPPLFQPASTPSPSPDRTVQAGGVHEEGATTQEAPPCGQTQHRCDSGIILKEKGWITGTESQLV